MVEIKPWSIGWLKFFKKQQKCFQALSEKFGHQLSITTINDWNFPIPQFNNQKFQSSRLATKIFGHQQFFFSVVGSMVIVD